MKIIVRLLLLVVLALLFSMLFSCSGTYWYETRRTATGKHGYAVWVWGTNSQCAGMHSRNPVKSATIRRLHFAPKHIKQ